VLIEYRVACSWRSRCRTPVRLVFSSPATVQALAMTVEDECGNIFRREVCENNASNDARDCVNWDNGAKYRDVKDAMGAWVQSAAEQ
jgi:hypothetical protein